MSQVFTVAIDQEAAKDAKITGIGWKGKALKAAIRAAGGIDVQRSKVQKVGDKIFATFVSVSDPVLPPTSGFTVLPNCNVL